MAKSIPYRNKLFVNTSWADHWPNPPDDTLPVTKDLRAPKFAIMRLRDGAMLAHHPTRGPLEKLARFFCQTGCQCVVRSLHASNCYWHDGESYGEFLANQRKYYAKRRGQNATPNAASPLSDRQPTEEERQHGKSLEDLASSYLRSAKPQRG